MAESFGVGLERAVRININLDGADLRGKDLHGLNLASGNFAGAHFEGCNCVGTNFYGADLTSADFSGAITTEAVFTAATTTGADKDTVATDSDGTTSTTATATPAANAIPKANSSGKLVSGWGGTASTLATLNASIKVVEDPANATATPTASKIPISSAATYLADGWTRVPPTAVDFAATAPYAVLAADKVIEVTTGAVTDDVELPTAVGCEGRALVVKKIDAGVGVVQVLPDGVEVIEALGAGVAYDLTVQGETVTLQSDGVQWYVLAATLAPAAHATSHYPAGADDYKPPAVDTAAATPFAVRTTHRLRV